MLLFRYQSWCSACSSGVVLGLWKRLVSWQCMHMVKGWEVFVNYKCALEDWFSVSIYYPYRAWNFSKFLCRGTRHLLILDRIVLMACMHEVTFFLTLFVFILISLVLGWFEVFLKWLKSFLMKCFWVPIFVTNIIETWKIIWSIYFLQETYNWCLKCFWNSKIFFPKAILVIWKTLPNEPLVMQWPHSHILNLVQRWL